MIVDWSQGPEPGIDVAVPASATDGVVVRLRLQAAYAGERHDWVSEPQWAPPGESTTLAFGVPREAFLHETAREYVTLLSGEVRAEGASVAGTGELPSRWLLFARGPDGAPELLDEEAMAVRARHGTTRPVVLPEPLQGLPNVMVGPPVDDPRPVVDLSPPPDVVGVVVSARPPDRETPDTPVVERGEVSP